MATMYVFNIPTNETVNLRKTASTNGTILIRVGYGKAVEASPSTTSGWHNASYNGCTGFIMSKFLSNTNPNGGGNSGGGSYLGTGTVIGGRLNCRKQAQENAGVWGQFASGARIPIYSCKTTGWYETRWPATGSNVGYVMSQYISMNNGDTGGDSSGGKTYTIGKYGATNTGAVFVRKSAGGEKFSTTEKLRLGSTFLIAGTEVSGSETWVKVLYGTQSGSTIYAYISATYFDELSKAPLDSAKERCITIAKSLNGVHEQVLGLKGNCCQQFIYWLCGACGKTVKHMPYGQDFCGDARDYFMDPQKGVWHSIKENYTPQPGDLVYYGETDGETSNHVGLVVKGGNNYQSIECNLSDKVKLCNGDVANEYCETNGMHIQGFATPTWN